MSDDDYGDDFEDYNEDFEDEIDLAPVVAPVKAPASTQPVVNTTVTKTPPVASSVPVSATDVARYAAKPLSTPTKTPASNQSNAVAPNRAQQRARQERLQLIRSQVRLSTETADIFDLAPVSATDAFLRALGRSNATIACAQTQFNDDWLSKDCQTEGVSQQSKSAQFPEIGNTDSIVSSDSSRLPKFIQSAAAVIESLLLDNITNQNSSQSVSRALFAATEESELFTACTKLKWSHLKHRRVTCTSFSPAHPSIILTAHSPVRPSANNEPQRNAWLDAKSLLLMWSISQPDAPQKVLCCDGVPLSLCFSPNRGHIVVAGMREGSLALWDLRESAALHRTLEESNLCVRAPTFCTDHKTSSNHQSVVTRLISLTNLVTSDTDSDQGKTSFQLASFDQTGKVNVWTVVETSVGDAAGSETELGLGLGGRVSLMQANSGESANIANSAAGSDKVKTPLKKKPVKTVESKTDTSNIVSASDFCFNLHDINEYFVALKSSQHATIQRFSRLGDKPSPSLYSPFPLTLALCGDDDFDAVQPIVSDAATAIDFCPTSSRHFLAGYQNGSICLYDVSLSEPIRRWETLKSKTAQTSKSSGKADIVCVTWSPHRASTFVAVNAQRCVFVFDLLNSDSSSIGSMQLSADSNASPLVALSSSVGSVRVPALAAASLDGSVDVHLLKSNFGEFSDSDRAALQTLLSST